MTTTLVLAPGLVVKSADGRAYVANVRHRTQLEGSAALLEILEFFREPREIAAFMAEFECEPEDLDLLVAKYFLIDVERAAWLADGLLKPLDHTPPIGSPATLAELVAEVHATETPAPVAVIGAPVDFAALEDSGARHGPREIRRAFSVSPIAPLCATYPAEPDTSVAAKWGTTPNRVHTLLDLEFRRKYVGGHYPVSDLGDIQSITGEDYKLFGERLTHVTSTLLDRGYLPVVLGGDHSITRFALRACRGRFERYGVIHFDAHPDLQSDTRGVISALTHANPFREVLEDPAFQHLFQIGLRTVESLGTDEDLRIDPRISYISGRELRRRTPEQILANLPRDLPWYVSFDVDCITPTLAKETGTPALGGLDYYDGLELFDHLGRDFNLIGVDFVEISGPVGGENWAARVTARYLQGLLLARSPSSPLDSYLFDTRPF